MALEKIRLDEVFRLVRKPHYIVGTTYTLSLAFFESVVFPCIDRSALRRCVIVSDSFGFDRAIDEATALENAGQAYIVAAPPSSRCLHAKVWLLASDAEAVLLVGSGNLTQSGFVGNTELFDVLHLNASSPASLSLLSSIQDFLRGLASLWPKGSNSLAADALAEISQAVAALPSAESTRPGEPTFLHSFDEALISQLPNLPDVKRVSLAAPFFGGDLAGVDLLAQKYPKAKLRVFPAVHRDESVDLPLDRVAAKFKNASLARLRVEAKPTAFQHLKLYAAEQKDGASWMFCTSANCTRAALNGSNIEAGILRSVTPTAVKDYFVTADKPLPQKRFEQPEGGPSEERLAVSAIDDGHSLRLFLNGEGVDALPLSDASISLRTGNAVATVGRDRLFSSGPKEAIAWADFTGWLKPRNRAVRVDVGGRAASGTVIRGSAFLENRLLLTSDPVHRSAWRGALALLDIEAVPELADIAAVFSLARGVFDTPLPTIEASAGDTRPMEASRVKPGIAVWPPQPDLHELHRTTSRTATGQLRWFQEVMRTLLAVPSQPTTSGDASDSGSDSSTGDADEGQRIERQQRALTIADRLWNYATRDYNAFYAKLHALEPAAGNASKVWPVAIFTFLATMGTLQASIRISAEVDWATEVDQIKDDFLRLMFAPRQQPDNYCCPTSARYRTEKFPALAEDLSIAFKERLHPDLATVVLAMVADQRMRWGGNKYKLMWEQRVRQIWSDEIRCDGDTKTVCRRVWQRFFVGEARERPTEDFDMAVDELCAIAATL